VPQVALDSTTVTTVALGFAAFALVLVVLLARRLGRLERAVRALPAARQPARVGREPEVAAELAQLRADLGTALRHVAVVRYDAFDDLAGRQSFSAALLDDGGDGVVLTSINGRSQTRTYAKGVAAGESGHPLSPEEREAIARARSAQPVPLASAS
jgi:hypothetical protein